MKGHGADTEEMAILYKKELKNIIDFSSNINPYVIKNFEEYILEGIKGCSIYPDINYRKLKENIADYLGVDKENIIPGNGATEIIFLLMKSIKGRLGIINPTFSEYERAAKLNNMEVYNLSFNKDKDFLLDIHDIRKNINKFDSLFICNPNNPTAKVQNIKELLDLLEKENKLLIVDETFMEFVEKEEDFSLIKYIRGYKNLIIIKAITKFFGIPGIRLGYGVTSNNLLLEKMYYYKEPWSINTFADTLSNYIFKDKEYIDMSKGYFKEERKYMHTNLSRIKKIKVYESNTNFILFKLVDDKYTSEELKKELYINSDILVRDASNFIGLDSSFIRIAIKSHKENKIIIEKLASLLGD